MSDPMTTNESAPDPTADEHTHRLRDGCRAGCPMHGRPATPPADDASEPRPSEADVEALANVFEQHFTPRRQAEHLARAVLASDWLAARDAEHEREVAALREAFNREYDWRRETRARAEAAERALADLRAAIKAIRRALDDELANLADDGARLSHSVVRRIEALLPRDDAAGAGGDA